jgi:hypothetical protein
MMQSLTCAWSKTGLLLRALRVECAALVLDCVFDPARVVTPVNPVRSLFGFCLRALRLRR